MSLELLTVAEAASRLAVHEDTIRRLLARGRLDNGSQAAAERGKPPRDWG